MDLSKYGRLFQRKQTGGIPENAGVDFIPRSAEAGKIEFQEILGAMYAEGRDVEQDDVEAAKWLDSAIRQGRNEARPKLNALIRKAPWSSIAEGRRRSYQLQQATVNAANRMPPCAPPGVLDGLPYMSARQLMEFASRYNNGDGVPVDFEVAFAAFLRAAELGIREAQYNIGLAYSVSKGVLGDPGKALEWLEKAVAQRYADAMLVAATLYIRGEGVPVDHAIALRYLDDAARTGHPMADKFAHAVRNGWEIE